MKDSSVLPAGNHNAVGPVLVELCLTDDIFFDTLNTSMAMIRLRSARPLHVPQNIDPHVPPLYSNQIKDLVELCQLEHKDPKSSEIKNDISAKFYKFQVIMSRSLSILLLFENKKKTEPELEEIISDRIKLLRTGMHSFTSTIINRNNCNLESSGDEDRTIQSYDLLRERMTGDINRMDAAGRILVHSSETIIASANETENYGVAIKKAVMVLNFLNKVLLAEKHMTRTAYLTFLTITGMIMLRRIYVENVIRIILWPATLVFKIFYPVISSIGSKLFRLSSNYSTDITAGIAQETWEVYTSQEYPVDICPLQIYRGLTLLSPFLLSGLSINNELMCHSMLK